jgi:hypothetical protein
VGFFPAVPEKDIEKAKSLAEALNHLEWAMDNTLKCLQESGMKVDSQIVFGRSFVLVRNGKRKTVALPSSPEDIGVYLLSPGKEPVVVTAPVGPSALIMMVPDAAARFFGALTCKEPWNK